MVLWVVAVRSGVRGESMLRLLRVFCHGILRASDRHRGGWRSNGSWLSQRRKMAKHPCSGGDRGKIEINLRNPNYMTCLRPDGGFPSGRRTPQGPLFAIRTGDPESQSLIPIQFDWCIHIKSTMIAQ